MPAKRMSSSSQLTRYLFFDLEQDKANEKRPWTLEQLKASLFYRAIIVIAMQETKPINKSLHPNKVNNPSRIYKVRSALERLHNINIQDATIDN